MNKINFTPFPILITEKLILRQINIEDLNEFFILKSDKRLLKYYDAKAKTYEEAYRKLKELNLDIIKNKSITWGIALKSENKLIGSICFWNISEENSKAEIGFELMFNWQRRGIMKEVTKTVIEYGFKDIKLKLIEAFPNPNNSKSVKLLERNNFIRGANFCETDLSNGNNLERVIYSLANDDSK